MTLCYACYFAACWVDPGTINEKTYAKAVHRFPYDGVLFTKKNKCTTCKFEKPARSKHCSMCNVCFEKFDHHCIWINGCVGLHNYRYFLAFIFTHFLITFYGVIVGGLIFAGLIEEKKLVGAKFRNNATGETIEADWMFIINYMMYHYHAFSFVVMLCMVCSIMLFIFFVYHMYLVKGGLTTNEKVKLSQMQHYLDKVLSFLQEWLRRKKEFETDESKDEFKPKKEAIEYYGVKAEMNTKQIEDKIKSVKKDIEKTKNLPYTGTSFWGNLYQVMFPNAPFP